MFRQFRRHPALTQKMQGNFLVQNVVFDQQDVAAGQYLRDTSSGADQPFLLQEARLGNLAGQFKPESATDIGSTADADLPAHQLHQMLADGQPQAGTAKAACGRVVSLSE